MASNAHAICKHFRFALLLNEPRVEWSVFNRRQEKRWNEVDPAVPFQSTGLGLYFRIY